MTFQILPGLLLLLLCQGLHTTVPGDEVVAVGPRHPVCATVGEDARLSCHLSPQMSAEHMGVSWSKNSGAALVHMYLKGTEYEEKQEEMFKGRTRMIRTDIGSGAMALELSNVTRSDAGIYACAFVADTPKIATTAEFELKVAGKSACDLEKELDILQKFRDFAEKNSDRDNRQKYAAFIENQSHKVQVTLDPDTAHPHLVLSVDRRHVRRTETLQDLPDNPRRFPTESRCPCVLGSEGFNKGRHYWEVQVEQDGRAWDVGITVDSVSRMMRGWSPKIEVWAVTGGSDGLYAALTSPETNLTLRERPRKLGVYLDYEGGRLSVYNADTLEQLYTFTQASFTEQVFPFFGLWGGAELSLV